MKVSLSTYADKTQGNRCGHNKYVPRVFDKAKRLLPFLEKAKDSMAEAYHHPLKYDVAILFYHRDKLKKDGSYRKVRSERIETLTTRLGRAIIHHTNLATLTLGYYVPQLNNWHYYDYSYLAKAIGASYSQIERAMRHFIKAGYIAVEERHERLADGEFKSLAPKITINARLFIDLGFPLEQVMFHVERAKAKLEKVIKKVTDRIAHIPQLFDYAAAKAAKAAKVAAQHAREEIRRLTKLFKRPPS